MSALLRAELIKLRTTRTFVAFVAASLALSLLVVVLTTILADDITKDDLESLFTADFSGIFILLLGVMGMAGEWRHRTITSTVLAAPDRLRLLAAKTIAYAVAGAVLSLIVTLTIIGVGSLILSIRDETTLDLAGLADVLWRNLALAALFGALGVGIGGLLRNQVAGIVGVLIFAFVVEPTVLALAPDVGRFGPTSGLANAIQRIDFDDADLLAPGVAVLAMLGWIGAAFAAAAVLLRRRDLT